MDQQEKRGIFSLEMLPEKPADPQKDNSESEPKSDIEYLPSLSEIENKYLAQGLIEQVGSERKLLSQEMELAKQKGAALAELKNQLVSSQIPERSYGNSGFKEIQEKIDRLIEIFESENPYQILFASAQNNSFNLSDEHLDEILSLRETFSLKKKIKSTALFWKKDEHNQKREDAQKKAKAIILNLIINLLTDSQLRIAKATQEGSKENCYTLVSNLFESKKNKFPEALDKLSKEITSIGKNLEMAENFNLFSDYLRGISEKIKKAEFEDCYESKTIDWMINSHIIGKAEDFQHLTRTKKGILEEELKESRIGLQLKSKVDEARRRLRDSFSPKNKGFNEKALYAITQEYIQEIESLNSKISEIESHFGHKIEKIYYYNTSAQEARKISSGRILTHCAPPEKMYSILRGGVLSSAHDYKTRTGKEIKRTTGKYVYQIEHNLDPEAHQISFEPDRINSNFSDNEDHGGLHYVNMAILLGENQLLSEGRPFCECDGIHIFDKEFRDESSSKGLSLDLKTIPFMILVSEKEYDKLLAFLENESAWKEELREMDENYFQEWLSDHIIITKDLRSWAADEKTKQKIHSQSGISPRDGFVEFLGRKAEQKVGSQELKRFVAKK
jgi:hypothetical protein